MTGCYHSSVFSELCLNTRFKKMNPPSLYYAVHQPLHIHVNFYQSGCFDPIKKRLIFLLISLKS